MNKLQKWEIAMMAGAAATILCCAAPPKLTLGWWTTAFSPLCDGILGTEALGDGVVLRSWLWDLLARTGH